MITAAANSRKLKEVKAILFVQQLLDQGVEGGGGIEVLGNQLLGGDGHIELGVDLSHDGHDVEGIQNLIVNEVNVKELDFVEGAGILVKKVKCNFRTMGKKFGKLMKGVAAAMDNLSQEQIAQLENQGSISVVVDGADAVVELADVDIISEDIPGWLVANEGNLTVALEVELTEELKNEGMARELINRIQNIRKESGLEITDRIKVLITPSDVIKPALDEFGDYIKTQVLADAVDMQDNEGQEVDFDGLKLNIKVEKQ